MVDVCGSPMHVGPVLAQPVPACQTGSQAVKETLRWAEGLDGLMSLGSIDPNVATTRKVVVASSLKQDMDVASPRGAKRKRSTSRRPKTDAKQGHSGASQLQLLQLAAAFRLCPAPSQRQILGISKRLNLPADRLEEWFHSRRVREPPAEHHITSCILNCVHAFSLAYTAEPRWYDMMRP